MGGMEGVISLSNCVVRASLSKLLEVKKKINKEKRGIEDGVNAVITPSH